MVGALFEASTHFDPNQLSTIVKIGSNLIETKILVIHSCNLEDFDKMLWEDIREQTEDLTSVIDMSHTSRKGYFYIAYTQDENIDFLYSNGYAVLEIEVFETSRKAIAKAEERLSEIEGFTIESMSESALDEDYMIYRTDDGEELGRFSTKEEAEQTLEKWEVNLPICLSFGAAVAPSGCRWDARSNKWKSSNFCACKNCCRTVGQGTNEEKQSIYCKIHEKIKSRRDSNQPKLLLVTAEVKELPTSKVLTQDKTVVSKKGFGKVSQISKKKTKKR